MCCVLLVFSPIILYILGRPEIVLFPPVFAGAGTARARIGAFVHERINFQGQKKNLSVHFVFVCHNYDDGISLREHHCQIRPLPCAFCANLSLNNPDELRLVHHQFSFFVFLKEHGKPT